MHRHSKAPILGLAFSILLSTGATNAQTADLSVFRVVGSICGAGFSADVQGELDANIARVLSSIETKGDASVDIGRAVELLKQFKNDEGKREVYGRYVDCVIQSVTAIAGVGNQDGSEEGNIVVDSFLVPDPLAIIHDGEQFAMSEKDIRSITERGLMLSLEEFKGEDDITVSWSNIRTGRSGRENFLSEAEAVEFSDNCRATLYSINSDEKIASFLLNCPEIE